MKNKAKIIIGLSVACVSLGILGACASGVAPYDDIGGIEIRFDPNGGRFANTENVQIVDVYPTAQVEKGIKILAPGDSKRGETASAQSSVSRDGYFLAGWYAGVTQTRVNDDGEMLDEYGEVTADENKQGYVYTGRWDFENDKLTMDSLNPTTVNGIEYSLTLYAAWIPNYKYEFYHLQENIGGSEWKSYGESVFNPVNYPEKAQLSLPDLDEEGVAMVYDGVPQLEGKTFVSAYAGYNAEDDQLENQLGETFTHPGAWDEETGTATNVVAKIYTKWRDGVWYNISTAEQLSQYANASGCYNIWSDLDFTDVEWSAAFARGTFTGTINGQGHKISNVTVNQNQDSHTSGGLFGQIAASAKIENINFENATLNINKGSRLDCMYGLLAGNILDANGEVFDEVTISGKIVIGKNLIAIGNLSNYSIGLLSGNSIYQSAEITQNITCEGASDLTSVTVSVEGGKVLLTPKQ